MLYIQTLQVNLGEQSALSYHSKDKGEDKFETLFWHNLCNSKKKEPT